MKIFKITEKNYTSNCYIIMTSNKNAIIIDPNNFYDINKIVFENKIFVKYIILTHEHYDHVCAVNDIKDNYKDVVLISSKSCSELLAYTDFQKNRFRLYLHYMGVKKDIELADCKLYKSDIEFKDSYKFNIDDCFFYLKETVGHSIGSISIILNDKYLFSGDSVLFDKDIIVKLSGGSMDLFKKYAKPYFKSLDRNLIVMPGHGDKFSLGEKIDKSWKD